MASTVVAALLGLFGTPASWAQTTTGTAGIRADPRAAALDRFEPSEPLDSFSSVQSPRADHPARWGARLTATYASRPLAVRLPNDEQVLVVSEQAVVHAQLAGRVSDGLTLDLDVPVTWLGSGQTAVVGANELVAPAPGTLHDARLGGRLTVVEQAGFVPSLGLSLRVWLPSGDDQAYTSAGRVRHAVHALIGADDDIWSYRLSFGRRQHGARGDVRLLPSDSALSFAAGYRPRPGLLLGGELDLLRASSASPDAVGSTTNAELLASASLSLGPWALRWGAGPGLGSAPGTPRWRVLASLAFVPRADAGGDAGAAEPRLEPPALALDGGGSARAAAEPAGDRRAASPAGSAADRIAEGGSPRAGDVEPIAKDHDAKDDDAKDDDAKDDDAKDDDANAVRLSGDQLRLRGEVLFESGSDVIEPSSSALLSDLVRELDAHPEIARVAVDGHTDDVGQESHNLVLSQRRAIAVVRWLVAAGVDERRLEARGLGPRQPRVPNDSDAGRLANRRVEFMVIRRHPSGRRGWRDGGDNE